MSRRVAATALNVLSSVAVVFGNKRLFGDTHAFAFPMMLTAIHLSCTSIAIRLVPRKQSRDLPYEAVLPLAIGRVLSIITMNMNLLHNSVSAYQLSKIALLPITTIASYIRGASLSPRALLGAALVTVGVSLATVANPTTSMKGLLVAILAILCTVVAIIQGEQSKTFGLPAVDIMRRETPVSATLMVLLASQIESVRDVMAFPYDTSSILMILFTAICAVCINFTGFAVVMELGAVGYLMVGHFKTLIILFIGYCVEPHTATAGTLFGSLVAILGLALYASEDTSRPRKAGK